MQAWHEWARPQLLMPPSLTPLTYEGPADELAAFVQGEGCPDRARVLLPGDAYTLESLTMTDKSVHLLADGPTRLTLAGDTAIALEGGGLELEGLRLLRPGGNTPGVQLNGATLQLTDCDLADRSRAAFVAGDRGAQLAVLDTTADLAGSLASGPLQTVLRNAALVGADAPLFDLAGASRLHVFQSTLALTRAAAIELPPLATETDPASVWLEGTVVAGPEDAAVVAAASDAALAATPWFDETLAIQNTIAATHIGEADRNLIDSLSADSWAALWPRGLSLNLLSGPGAVALRDDGRTLAGDSLAARGRRDGGPLGADLQPEAEPPAATPVAGSDTPRPGGTATPPGVTPPGRTSRPPGGFGQPPRTMQPGPGTRTGGFGGQRSTQAGMTGQPDGTTPEAGSPDSPPQQGGGIVPSNVREGSSNKLF